MRPQKILLAIALFAAALSSASAEVLTFDDLSTVVKDPYALDSVAVPNGYHGFNWDNVFVLDSTEVYLGSGYQPGTISGTNVAFNVWDRSASFSSNTPFTLESMYVTKAWLAGVTHFEGYVGNTLTYQLDVSSTTTSPVFTTFGWSGLNRVTFSDANGTWQTAIDNVNVTAVPEPEPFTMLLAGMGLLCFLARKRRA